MRRPTPHALLLTLFILLTLLPAAALFIPVRLGPFFAGRDLRSSPFYFETNRRHLLIYFLTHPLTPRDPSAPVMFHDAGEDSALYPPVTHTGVAYERFEWISNGSNLVVVRGHQLRISWWWFLLTSLPIAALLAFPYFRRLRQKSLTDPRSTPCPRCAYDLRAHTPGEKCPECGTSTR